MPNQTNTPPEYPSDRVMTKREFLNKIYNEQLDQLVRTEVDLSLVDRLVIMKPSNQEYVQRRGTLKEAIEIKTQLIELLEAKLKEADKNG